MEQILFATNNPTKAKRFSKGLLKNNVEVVSLKDLNVSIEIDENGEESTYTWYKDDFYMVDVASNKVDSGYPLNSISKYKKLNKYFTELSEEDKELIKFNEDHVVDFIKSHI